MKMKNLILFVVVFSAAVLLAACITTVVCAREVTTNVYYNYEPDILKITDTHYTSENGHVELKGTSESDGILKATFVSKSVRPSQKLCKPPIWCKIEAPYWRFNYEQQKKTQS